MRLLILGGIGEAKKLVHMLSPHFPSAELIYSIAGKVRTPILPAKIHRGGFSQYATPSSTQPSLDGLVHFLQAEHINTIIDVTHPFAKHISTTAQAACRALKLTYWQYQRPQWQAEEGDNWVSVTGWPEAQAAIINFKHPFITLGGAVFDTYFTIPYSQHWLIRSALFPASLSTPLPKNCTAIQAIGPFSEEAEHHLMQTHHIDVLISKNSGGDRSKLDAARKLGIPVVMIARPENQEKPTAFQSTQNKSIMHIQNFNQISALGKALIATYSSSAMKTAIQTETHL